MAGQGPDVWLYESASERAGRRMNQFGNGDHGLLADHLIEVCESSQSGCRSLTDKEDR
jgi:hypothetical protein